MTYGPVVGEEWDRRPAAALGAPVAWSSRLPAAAAVAAVAVPPGGSRRLELPTLPAPARANARAGAIAGWIGAGIALLLCWSVSYLLRQPGLDPSAPFSPLGSFALEGMLLGLVWMAAIAALALALAAGRIVVRHDG